MDKSSFAFASTEMAAPDSIRPDIYQYDDFRGFLKDFFAFKKHMIPDYSYRKFAASAGIANPGYLLDVVAGKRSLSRNQAGKMAAAFELNASERNFFLLLVQFGQCKKGSRCDGLYQEILARRNRSRFARLSPLVKYYQDYRYSLVRCAVEAMDFRGDCDALGNFLDPSMPASQVRRYVRDLEEWRLIHKTEDGRYRVTQKFVEPPPTLSALVRRLNREWVLQAAEVPLYFGPSERHVSTLLLNVSRETQRRLLEKAEAFRQEVLNVVENDRNPETILQLSLQMFPKSRRPSLAGNAEDRPVQN